MNGNHHISLILCRKESGGSPDEANQRKRHEHEGEECHQVATANHACDDPRVPPLELRIDAIEPSEKQIFHAIRIGCPEPERALRGLERHRVDAADEGRDRNHQRELTVHLADDSRQESGWQKNGHQNQRDRHDGSEEFLHGGNRGILRRFAPLQMLGRTLDHDDGVIHHDADGEDDAEQGEGIDAKAHGGHPRKGPDDCYRDRGGRDERCPPILEEYNDDQEDQ